MEFPLELTDSEMDKIVRMKSKYRSMNEIAKIGQSYQRFIFRAKKLKLKNLRHYWSKSSKLTKNWTISE